jgi:hypothetical protein
MGSASCKLETGPPAYEASTTAALPPASLTVRRLQMVLCNKSTTTDSELRVAFAELVAAKVVVVPAPLDLDLSQLFALVDTVLYSYKPDEGRCVADINVLTRSITWLPEYPDVFTPTRTVAWRVAAGKDPVSLGIAIACLSSPPSTHRPIGAEAQCLAETIAQASHLYSAYTLVGGRGNRPFSLRFFHTSQTQKE